MPIQRVIIVRHGETDYNAQHRWQGHLDVPLNEIGQQQAQRLAKHFLDEALDGIFASDLKRAFDTAQPLALAKKLSIIPDKRLREVHLGLFQGLTRIQIQDVYPQESLHWNNDDAFIVPNGESRIQLQNRVVQAFEEITKRSDMSNIMIVSHGGAIRMLLQKILPQVTERLRFQNTSFTVIERDKNDAWQASVLNITPDIG